MIGGVAPNEYLYKLQQHEHVKLDDWGLNKILETHLIPTEALRANDFENFYNERKKALLRLIEDAIKKPISIDNLDRSENSESYFEEEINSI